jgi:hypothetical protein
LCTVIVAVVAVVVVVVSMGVRGKPQMYYSLLVYCTARFGRYNFDHQMPPRLPTLAAEVETYGQGIGPLI